MWARVYLGRILKLLGQYIAVRGGRVLGMRAMLLQHTRLQILFMSCVEFLGRQNKDRSYACELRLVDAAVKGCYLVPSSSPTGRPEKLPDVIIPLKELYASVPARIHASS